MRWVTVGVWALTVVVSLWVASETTIGPVVIQLSTNHGIHLGDLVVVALAIAVAATVTVVAFARRSA